MKGRKVNVGDEVTLHGTVTSVDFCDTVQLHECTVRLKDLDHGGGTETVSVWQEFVQRDNDIATATKTAKTGSVSADRKILNAADMPVLRQGVSASRKINILGSEWTVSIRTPEEDEDLADMDGYTDWTTKTICVGKHETCSGSVRDMKEYIKKVIRHEIVHAFMFESGLAENSAVYPEGWAHNEEMVDWIAFNGPKVYEAWKEAGAI